MKNARGMEIYKLEYRHRCDKLLDKIYLKSPQFGERGAKGTNMKITRQIQFIYASIFPDYKKRVAKISAILLGKYVIGDELLLRMAYSFLSDIKNVQKEINAGFKEEIKEYIAKMNSKNPKP